MEDLNQQEKEALRQLEQLQRTRLGLKHYIELLRYMQTIPDRKN